MDPAQEGSASVHILQSTCPPGLATSCSSWEADSGGFCLWLTSEKTTQWKRKIPGSKIGQTGVISHNHVFSVVVLFLLLW